MKNLNDNIESAYQRMQESADSNVKFELTKYYMDNVLSKILEAAKETPNYTESAIISVNQLSSYITDTEFERMKKFLLRLKITALSGSSAMIDVPIAEIDSNGAIGIILLADYIRAVEKFQISQGLMNFSTFVRLENLDEFEAHK